MSDVEKSATMATEHSENLSVSEHREHLDHKNRVEQVHADGELATANLTSINLNSHYD